MPPKKNWNRTTPTGHKLVRQKLDNDGKYTGTEDFITDWLNEENKALGRPVGLLFAGSDLYISDDQFGIIYRVSH